jgi:TetR/AcrR family transcriptional regulator
MSKAVPQKILDATLEVIAREKISGTRMHLIAAEAEMTQSNLHYYFSTKNELLIALLNDIQEWFSSTRKQGVNLQEKTFAENLQNLFAEKQEVILNNKKLDYVQFDYWVQGTVNPEIRETFQKTFNIWRRDIETILNQAGSPEPVDLRRKTMLPFFMVSLMMGASMQYLIDEGKFDLEQYFSMAEAMVINFLGAGAEKMEVTQNER